MCATSKGNVMSGTFDSQSTESVLGPTLCFKGDLSVDEDLVILGSVEGSIEHTARLVIGEDGKIKADIQGENIRVDGKVEGNLHARSSVSIGESANVIGDVYAPTVALVEGARFKGKIDMGSNKAD